MKYAKKTLALLLALAMLFSMAPASFTASAEETTPKLTFTEPTAEETEETAAPAEAVTVPEEAPETTQPDAAGTQIPTVSEKIAMEPWVNPLYADVLDADDLKPHVPQAQPDASVQASYVSVSDAGIQLRSQLKSRIEEITLYVIADTYDYEVALSEVLEVALAHTGNAREGDYLNYNIAGMDGSYSRHYGNKYRYDFELTFTYITTAAQETQVTNAVSSLITSLGIRYKSDYEQISAVYDYMCQNITYDYDHLEDPSYLTQFSAYGAIIDKTAVCQGYALLFYRIMLELGVDCRVIAGIGGDAENYGPHAWNIVEIDGLYYNLDTTWDAGSEEYVWFLRSTRNFIYHTRYLEYETLAFHNQHPMAVEDYDPDVPAEADPLIYAGYCGDEIVWILTRDGELLISGVGAMYDYGTTDDTKADWKYVWSTEITSITIEGEVTYIGDNSFGGLWNLTSVTLPDGLEGIGEKAFQCCYSLTQINLPDSIQEIESQAFAYCTSLDVVHLPSQLRRLGQSAFAECTSLTEITFPEGMTGFGAYMFSRCTSLSSVTLPSTLTTISYYAFEYCNSLSSIILPDGLTTIGDHAFYMAGLTSIEIPGTVTTIGVDAFRYCAHMTSLVLCDGITTTGEFAFRNCANLTDVTLPDTLTTIGMYTFSFDKALENIDLPDGLLTIGNNAFEYTNITSLEIPGTVTTIATQAFKSCFNLNSIYFKGDVPNIDSSSFYGVTANAYYPLNNDTWTEDVMSKYYGGKLTWLPAPHDHEYESVVTPPTCTEQGYTTYSCTLCVESYVADYTDPTGHTPGEVHVENEVPATCTEKGSYDNVTLCAVCGEECGRETVETDLIPHTPGEVHVENEIPATCTEKGSYDNVTLCAVCGLECGRETVETDTIPHTYSDTVTDPTCEEQGCTTHTCTVCGDTYADSYTDALGHIYADYTVTGKPTRNSTGELTGTCTRCGGTTTVVLPALNEEDYTCEVILEPTDDEHGSAIYTWNVTDYGTVVIEVRLRKLSGLPLGDLNDDGEVDIFDANLIVAWYNGTADLDEDQQEAADVNGDGEADIFDANLVVAYYNGTITEFPET